MSDDRPATSRRRFLALCAGAAGSFVPGVARAHERMSAEERKAELGQWMIRSTDGGRTWWTTRWPCCGRRGGASPSDPAFVRRTHDAAVARAPSSIHRDPSRALGTPDAR